MPSPVSSLQSPVAAVEPASFAGHPPVAAAFGLLGPSFRRTAPRPVKVADDLYVIQNANHTVAEIGQNGGNVTVIVTSDGVILVDSKFERMHDDIMAKVKSVTDGPSATGADHNHGDHSGGSARFSRWASRWFPPWPRERTWPGQHAGTCAGGLRGSGAGAGRHRLELREFRGHTRGDTVVSLPARRACRGRPRDDARFHSRDRQLRRRRQLDRVGESLEAWPHGLRRPDRRPRSEPDQGGIPAFTTRSRHPRAVPRLNRERKSQDEIAQALIEEFNWGTGPAAGNLAGMMQELR